MPDLVQDQFNTDIEYQYISGLFKDRFTRHRVAKNASRKTHCQDANTDAKHHDPDLVREGYRCHYIINTEDQIHNFDGQHCCPKGLDFDRLDIFILIAATACHILQVVEGKMDQVCCANYFDPRVMDEETGQEQHRPASHVRAQQAHAQGCHTLVP